VTDILLQIGANFDGADKVNEQLNKIDRSLVDSVRAINRFDKEFKTLSTATKNQKLTQEGFNKALQQSVTRLLDTSTSTDRHTQSMERNTATMQRGQRVTLQTGSAQQVLRQRFLETANSIAVLDGPLGGVASRFSSFGVLVGRTGVLLAGAAVAFAGLSLAASRGIREFTEFEVQVATIENRLKSTSTQVSLTSREIVNLSDSIAMSTLASEKDLLRASAQILTFGSITTSVFEDVLRTATDLAASGFGTVESAAGMLSKALEDPRQSLTSLSRSGVTFTRQQREMIISMADAGRQAEAMKFILEQVNRQVGGAAEAQARDTFAGQFDTIGQSARLASRLLGEFVLETLRFGRVIEGVAAISGKFIELNTEEEGEKLVELRRRAEALRTALDGNIAQRAAVSFLELGVVGGDLEKRLRQVNSLINEIVNAPRLDSATSAIGRRESAIESLQAELDIRREVLFLTEDQQRIQRQLAAQGFGAGGLEAMQDEMKEVVEAMLAFGSSQEDIMRTVDGMVDRFREASQFAGDFNQLLQDERTASSILSNLTNLTQQNEIMELVNQNLLQGVSLAEARSNAEAQLLDNLLEMGDAALERLGLDRSAVELLREQVESSRLLVSQNAELTEERRQLDQMRGFIENLDEENRLLAVQLGFMDQGVEAAEARRLAEVEVEKQLLRQEQALLILQSALGDLNDLEAERLGLINAQLAAIETREVQRAEVAARSRSGGSTRGGGREKEDPLVKELERLQQFLNEAHLARLSDFERLNLEFDDRHELLRQSLERDLITRQQYGDMVSQLEYAREEELFNMKQSYMEKEAEMRKKTITDFIGLLGLFGQQSKTAAKASIALNTALRISEIIQDSARASTMALAIYGPTPAGFAAAASAKAYGVAQAGIAAAAGALRIGSVGRGGGSSGGASRASASEVAVPNAANQNAAPQRVIIQGLDPNALFTGEQLQGLFESFYNENENRGRVFVVQR
jgi:hypothetical protein